ncbi:hypothetical protein JX266_007115 [Neoarthrinium moseri]|nr:hypothetical protein JX266_007115 [Neoarthrinium moseri]
MSSAPSPNLPSAYGPKETALLLLDYHNIILGTISDADAKEKLITSTQKLLAAARASGAPVVHCLIRVDADPAPTSKLTERWATGFKPALAADPALGRQMGAVAGRREAGAREYFVDRVPGRVSALKSEGVLELLRAELGVKSLVLCGVVSSGCVLSTAREAPDEGFVATVVDDACWDREPEVHDLVMRKVLPMTAHVASLDEAVGYLGGAGEVKN